MIVLIDSKGEHLDNQYEVVAQSCCGGVMLVDFLT